MATPETLLILVAIFLLAGFVKGVVGFGLPTVALGLLTATQGLTEAMALMLVPSLATNLWQGLAGGALGRIMGRLWSFLAAACLGIWLGAGLLARSDAVLLAGVLGVLLCAYAVLSLSRPVLPPPGAREAWVSPVVGIANGFLTGLTGSFVVPGVPYLQLLGLPRDVLVQAMGVLFTVSTLALGVSLAGHDLLPPAFAALSAGAVVPAFLGMFVGQKLRHSLPEQHFRLIFLSALLLLGLYIAGRSLEHDQVASDQFCCVLGATAREAPSETRCRSIG